MAYAIFACWVNQLHKPFGVTGWCGLSTRLSPLSLASPRLQYPPWWCEPRSDCGAEPRIHKGRAAREVRKMGTFLPEAGRGTLHAGFAPASPFRQCLSSSSWNVRQTEYRFCGNRMPEQLGVARPTGDALLTDQAGILLSVRTADCLPVLLVDSNVEPWRRYIAGGVARWHASSKRPWGRCAECMVLRLRMCLPSWPFHLARVVLKSGKRWWRRFRGALHTRIGTSAKYRKPRRRIQNESALLPEYAAARPRLCARAFYSS